MKHSFSVLIIILSAFLLCACAPEQMQEEHLQINEPLAGDNIYTAEELLLFIEKGESTKATLAASISLEDEMIKLTTERGSLTIDGNGYTLSGTGDCVVRLENGCELALENIEIIGGYDAIGCLGDATIEAKNTRISSITHCINAAGNVTIAKDSDLTLSSNVGSGLNATGLTLEKGARLEANGDMSAIIVKEGNIELQESSLLKAVTKKDYNALKCDNTVYLKNGAELDVDNMGNYHGAEIGYIAVEGVVTIKAHGGSQGVGLFLFSLNNKIYALGECLPDLRFEVGKGEIVFLQSAAEVEAAIAAQAASQSDLTGDEVMPTSDD